MDRQKSPNDCSNPSAYALRRGLIMFNYAQLTLKICKALPSVPTSSLTRNWIIFEVGVTSNSDSAVLSVSAFKENTMN